MPDVAYATSAEHGREGPPADCMLDQPDRDTQRHAVLETAAFGLARPVCGLYQHTDNEGGIPSGMVYPQDGAQGLRTSAWSLAEHVCLYRTPQCPQNNQRSGVLLRTFEGEYLPAQRTFKKTLQNYVKWYLFFRQQASKKGQET